MMLRSSSTPVLGSLLSSFPDSPNNNNHIIHHHHHHHLIPESNAPFKHQHTLNRPPVYHHAAYITASSTSSPLSPSITDTPNRAGFRRAQSDGNLEGLAYASCGSNEDYSCNLNRSKKSGRSKCLMLETLPSFSFSNTNSGVEEEFEDDVTEGYKFGLSNKVGHMVLEEVGARGRVLNVDFGEERGTVCEEMFLARGIGTDNGFAYNHNGGGCGGAGGRGGDEFSSGGDGEDIHRTEEYYKRMVQEDPGNPLILRNYAQFIYQLKYYAQKKKDHQGAEEFYSRAILADPKDGEVLSQYANFVWEFHHDEERATSYHERAVQASPGDSHVQAVYASFLWEVEEEGQECDITKQFNVVPPNLYGAMASAGA